MHEGALHIARQRIISNRSLLKNADRSGLPQYIQSKPFTSKVWLPQNFTVLKPPRFIKPNKAGAPGEPIANDDPVAKTSFEQIDPPAPSENPGASTDPERKPTNNPLNDCSIPQTPESMVERENGAPHTTVSTSPEKPPVRTKAKRTQDDTNVQLLGDKVL